MQNETCSRLLDEIQNYNCDETNYTDETKLQVPTVVVS